MSVTLVLMAGTDLDVVNGARASLNVEHATLNESDEGLIRRCLKDGHTEPFRHAWGKFRVVCSIGAARQIMTHKRYSAISERSTRYSTFSDQFVMPPLKHQVGKAMDYAFEPLADQARTVAETIVAHSYERSYQDYHDLLDAGVAKEDARSVLPLGMQTALIWSADLAAWMRILSRRTDPHAQDEVRGIAYSIEAHLSTVFPVTLAAWNAAGRRAL